MNISAGVWHDLAHCGLNPLTIKNFLGEEDLAEWICHIINDILLYYREESSLLNSLCAASTSVCCTPGAIRHQSEDNIGHLRLGALYEACCINAYDATRQNLGIQII